MSFGVATSSFHIRAGVLEAGKKKKKKKKGRKGLGKLAIWLVWLS